MKKKLRSLLRIVFGRTAFMLLFIILQLAFFFGIVHWLSSEYSREFDSSFFGVLMQILYLSHLRLIFLSNFVIFIVLLCTLCGIIKKTDFIIGEKRYVYIYHWK